MENPNSRAIKIIRGRNDNLAGYPTSKRTYYRIKKDNQMIKGLELFMKCQKESINSSFLDAFEDYCRKTLKGQIN